MEKRSHILLKLVPIMLAFFAMGFVDLVGIATNYVKKDFELSDSVANLFTSMVFFWFLVCSVPTGMLMNKIGRRKTVILSLVLTSVALIIPLIDYNLPLILISFSLLGISNAVMQVSLNPPAVQHRQRQTPVFGPHLRPVRKSHRRFHGADHRRLGRPAFQQLAAFIRRLSG